MKINVGEKKELATHLVGLSELEFISIDNGVGARDNEEERITSFAHAIGFRQSFARDDDSQERKPYKLLFPRFRWFLSRIEQ